MTDPDRDDQLHELAERNMMYRRPELYDELTKDDDQAATVARIVAHHGGHVRTVLDAGCGTGRDLATWQAELGWSGIGVDLQPQLITYAHEIRPEMDARLGDIRTVRLGTSFDLITCLGNTLSYLLSDADLEAALVTFASHARPGTLLIIQTLTDRPRHTEQPHRHRIEATTMRATVTTSHAWDGRTGRLTTCRQWATDDGCSATDQLIRRVTPAEGLTPLLHRVGFASLDSPHGPIVARYLP